MWHIGHLSAYIILMASRANMASFLGRRGAHRAAAFCHRGFSLTAKTSRHLPVLRRRPGVILQIEAAIDISIAACLPCLAYNCRHVFFGRQLIFARTAYRAAI